MLRSLYIRILRVHPEHFQGRFGDEMLSIFDQAQRWPERLRLVLDGVVSVARQWMLRPEYWHEPVAPVTADGVPVFFTFGHSWPRPLALLDGAVGAVLKILLVISVMGYVWTHPMYMPVPGRGPSKPAANRVAAPPDNSHKLYWPPYEPPPETKPGSPDSSHTTAVPNTAAPAEPLPVIVLPTEAGPAGVSVPQPVLRSYVGNYGGDPPHQAVSVAISLQDSQLGMQVSDEPRTDLLAASETKFLADGDQNRWVEFAAPENGVVRRLDLYEPTRHVTARRK